MKASLFALSFVATLATSLIASGAEPPVVPNTQVPGVPPAMEAPKDKMDVQGAIKMPKAVIVSPKEGEEVTSPVTVEMRADGMKIEKAGKAKPGAGHFILIVDGAAVKKGAAVPMDAQHIHLGKGEMKTKVTLAPGAHTLTVQLADGAHLSYGEMMSQTVKITVK